MSDSILEVSNLVKKYPSFSLNKVSFNLPRGYIMGFVGQNGAGKSTTIRCILGVNDFEEGNITIFGQDIKKNPIEVKQRIGYVGDEHYLYEDMTPVWTGKFVGSFYKDWDSRLFSDLLGRFNIDKSKKIKELSKGTKMKLSLALALSHNPELLILDEPTSGLDPVARDSLLEMFLEIIQDEKRSILFSSHITSDMEKIADFITVINNGKILISDDKDTLINSWVMIKTENNFLTPELSKLLLGIKTGSSGTSAITNDIRLFTKKFNETFPNGYFKTDKINIDELLVRIVKDNENNSSSFFK